MPLGRALRILLALLLLSAQQLALSHQIWHFGKDAPDPAQEQICGHHDALGTVAGAVDSPPAAALCVAPVEVFFQHATLTPAATPGLAPSSRGPPSFL